MIQMISTIAVPLSSTFRQLTHSAMVCLENVLASGDKEYADLGMSEAFDILINMWARSMTWLALTEIGALSEEEAEPVYKIIDEVFLQVFPYALERFNRNDAGEFLFPLFLQAKKEVCDDECGLPLRGSASDQLLEFAQQLKERLQ